MNQREELRATKATTSDLGSWMVYMVDDGEADKKEMWFAAGVECDLVTAAAGRQSFLAAGQVPPPGLHPVLGPNIGFQALTEIGKELR